MLKKIADYPMTGSQAAVVLSAELVLFYLGIK